MCAHEVVNSGKWSGGGIVRLDSALVRPSAADVAINFHVLKPVIEEFPDRVPSGYFLTDCIMWLDTLFKGQLLVGANTKLQIAAEEGVKIKKLVGAVRSLWRSSPAGNHPRVTQLKGLLRPSPSRSREEKEGSDCSDIEEAMPSDDDEVSPVPVQDGQDESDEAQEDRRDHDSLSASTLRLPGRVFWTRNTSFLSEKVSWFCSELF
ncbi:unnamed protein product [Durusdinium trenchii]|uniref:Uncharacterized protein n=1 Tax=Durusdinium trenchii TaxID=1381693 RepID=A0ABP0KZ17_9DINO